MWADMQPLLALGVDTIRALRRDHGTPLGDATSVPSLPALAHDFALTGFRETNFNAL